MVRYQKLPRSIEHAEVLNNLDVKSKVLVVLEDDNEKAALAARNLANVTVIPAKLTLGCKQGLFWGCFCDFSEI